MPTLVFGKPGFGGGDTDISGRDMQISVQTTRPLAEMLPLLQQLQSQTQGLADLTDIDTTFKPGKPELQFHLDPAKIGNLGYTNDQIASSVRALINGDTSHNLPPERQGHRCGRAAEARRSASASTAMRGTDRADPSGSVPLSTLGTVELYRRPDRPFAAMIGRTRC